MELAHLVIIAPLAAVVLLPLAREYADFRNEWGLSRVAALATTLLVLPALAVGLSVSLAFAQEPAVPVDDDGRRHGCDLLARDCRAALGRR